jgi:phosphotransferase system HPr (HPr) family protein
MADPQVNRMHEQPHDQSVAEAVVTVAHPAGLHLRPAAQFVQTAARFASQVTMTNLSRPQAQEVDAKSMFGLMQSGVSQGHRILVRAEGSDASAAVTALQALVERNFEEP